MGFLLVLWLSDGIDLTEWAAGVELFGMRSVLVPRLLLADVVLVAAMSIAFGLIASLYPAWRAVQIGPLDALRR